jgi:hypothetical protein
MNKIDLVYLMLYPLQQQSIIVVTMNYVWYIEFVSTVKSIHLYTKRFARLLFVIECSCSQVVAQVHTAKQHLFTIVHAIIVPVFRCDRIIIWIVTLPENPLIHVHILFKWMLSLVHRREVSARSRHLYIYLGLEQVKASNEYSVIRSRK